MFRSKASRAAGNGEGLCEETRKQGLYLVDGFPLRAEGARAVVQNAENWQEGMTTMEEDRELGSLVL